MVDLYNTNKKCFYCNHSNIECFGINEQINEDFFKNKTLTKQSNIYNALSNYFTVESKSKNNNDVIYLCENCLKIALDQKYFGFEVNNNSDQNINFIYQNSIGNNALTQMIEGYKKINHYLLDRNIQVYKNIQSIANKINEISQINKSDKNINNHLLLVMKKLNYLIELLKKVANPENDSRKLGKVFINQIEYYKNELIKKFMNNKIQDNRKQFEDSLIYIPNNVNTNLNYDLYYQGMNVPFFKNGI